MLRLVSFRKRTLPFLKGSLTAVMLIYTRYELQLLWVKKKPIPIHMQICCELATDVIRQFSCVQQNAVDVQHVFYYTLHQSCILIPNDNGIRFTFYIISLFALGNFCQIAAAICILWIGLIFLLTLTFSGCTTFWAKTKDLQHSINGKT